MKMEASDIIDRACFVSITIRVFPLIVSSYMWQNSTQYHAQWKPSALVHWFDGLLSGYPSQPLDGSAQPNLVSLSLMGKSLPVTLLYLSLTKSEICSSFACSIADSLSCGP